MQKKYLDTLFVFTLGYAITIFMLLVFNFVIYENVGFTRSNFIIVTTITVVVGIFIGYFLSQKILDPFFEQDQIIEKFAKNTLHEINIPVATILANITMLEKTVTGESEVKKITRIKTAAYNLLELYRELDYSLKTQTRAIINENFNLNHTITETVNPFLSIHPNLIITIDINNDLNLFSDPKGFAKTISNLIDNGIKYSTQPTKKIEIFMSEKTLNVADNGIGIDSYDLLKIFERYYQKDENKSGYGIGLHLAKEYCDKNKIGIWVESQKDVGTTFKLDLSKVLV